jgi:hypothetical protein
MQTACLSVLRTFRTKKEDVTGVLRKCINDKLHNFCSGPDIINVIRIMDYKMDGHVARMCAMSNSSI